MASNTQKPSDGAADTIRAVLEWHNASSKARPISADDLTVETVVLPYWQFPERVTASYRYEIGSYSAQAEALALQRYQASLAEYTARLSDAQFRKTEVERAINHKKDREGGNGGIALAVQDGFATAALAHARAARPRPPTQADYIGWTWSRPRIIEVSLNVTLAMFHADAIAPNLSAEVGDWLQAHGIPGRPKLAGLEIPFDESVEQGSPEQKATAEAAILRDIKGQGDAQVRGYEVLQTSPCDEGVRFTRFVWKVTVRDKSARTTLLVGRDGAVFGERLSKPIPMAFVASAIAGCALLLGALAFLLPSGASRQDMPASQAVTEAHSSPTLPAARTALATTLVVATAASAPGAADPSAAAAPASASATGAATQASGISSEDELANHALESVRAELQAGAAADSAKPLPALHTDQAASVVSAGVAPSDVLPPIVEQQSASNVIAAPVDATRALTELAGQPNSGRFVVQVGAFLEDAKLTSARDRVGALGMKTYTQPVETPAGHRIRVRVGPFGTKDAADQAAGRVKSSGLPAVVLAL